MEEKRMVEMGEERTRQQLHTDDEEGFENQELDDRKLLSRYGVWLLVEMSPPKENIPIVSNYKCLFVVQARVGPSHSCQIFLVRLLLVEHV